MAAPALTRTLTFEQAARSVLAYLREHVPMGFWSVTRVENGRQSYLYLEDNAYGLVQGGSHPWADSFCVHMAAGTAPAVAPDLQRVPLYAAAGVNAAARIGAYAGTPIYEDDGTLFGAICGLDPEVADDPAVVGAGPLLALLGQLLTAVLHAERGREVEQARVVEAELAAQTDALTGLHNRRAWDRQLADALANVHRLGDPTVLAIADLDDLKVVNDSAGHAAGDAHLQRAATALTGAVRRTDVVARIGGDEFGILLRGCDEAAAEARLTQLRLASRKVGVEVSVGWAPLTLQGGLPTALAAADEAMYAAKRARRVGRPRAVPAA